MMKHVRPMRVASAIEAIFAWRNSIQAQATAHLLPLLALLEAGAGRFIEVQLEEVPDEYAFWDKYFRISEPPKPYFNPLTKKLVDATYPHSNTATIRKNTFANRWRAVSLRIDDARTYWTLSSDYAAIVRNKMLTKANTIRRVPVLDLSAILFRGEEFSVEADSRELEARFRERFPMSAEDYEQIFEFSEESADSLYALDPPAGEEYNTAILSTLLADDPKAERDRTPHSIPEADDSDQYLLIVQELLRLGTSGLIFEGAPGTGKTREAHRVARRLVDDAEQDIFVVQFHPAFGYEDFIEGYRPDDHAKSGFEIADKVFLRACARAKSSSGYVIILIDEINRGDPSRIFGEVLTYLERDYRGRSFLLPFSGRKCSVPDNLLIIGTLNPYDRSVSQADAAFVRRFDHIAVDPSAEALADMLHGSSFSPDQLEIIVRWFEQAQNIMPIGLGHGLFRHVADLASLRTIWTYRIAPTCVAILDHDPDRKEGLLSSFQGLLSKLEAFNHPTPNPT